MSTTATTTPSTTASVGVPLKIAFIVVPIVAGIDKFTNILTHWVQYLNPAIAHHLPMAPESFMKIVGVIEIIAGILVAVVPKVGSFIVGVWLCLIALTLLVGWMYVDIAVRDLVMAVAAFTLCCLSSRR